MNTVFKNTPAFLLRDARKYSHKIPYFYAIRIAKRYMECFLTYFLISTLLLGIKSGFFYHIFTF